MAGVLKSILVGYQIRIVPTGGWASFTYERNNLKRLKEETRQGKKVHILYLGDYDPSGLRIVSCSLSKNLVDVLIFADSSSKHSFV